MPEHRVVLYQGPSLAFKGRWTCVCEVLMPKVAFGHPLNKAFAEHMEEVERSD